MSHELSSNELEALFKSCTAKKRKKAFNFERAHKYLFDSYAARSNAIAFKTDDLPILNTIGQSHMGGIPDVDPSFIWPVVTTSSPIYDYMGYYSRFNLEAPSEPETHALSFVGQFNCEDLAAFDIDGLLPKQGLLLFFHDFRRQIPGINKGAMSKVIYYPKVDDLVPYCHELWADNAYSNIKAAQRAPILPHLNITSLHKVLNFPNLHDIYPNAKDANGCFGANGEDIVKVNKQILNKTCKAVVRPDSQVNTHPCESKLLGHSAHKSRLVSHCEYMAHRLYGNDQTFSEKATPPRFIKNAFKEWQLLLQLDRADMQDRTVDESLERRFKKSYKDYQLAKYYYFYIRKSSLLNLDFSQVVCFNSDSEIAPAFNQPMLCEIALPFTSLC